MQKQKLVVICGPTATGKTALAVSMAQRFGGEVVSADSMQIYKGMDIGTAKPTEQERGGIPHHMIDFAEIGEEYGASFYSIHARECIEDIAERGKLPILCGGTGLYISAVVYPLDFNGTGADTAYRAELADFANKYGSMALYQKLAELDAEAANAIHPNNVRRVIRALEIIKKQGNSCLARSQKIFNDDPLFELAWVGLTMDRGVLYSRIDARVDNMMEMGLLEEVETLAKQYGKGSIAFQALGYKELLCYLNGQTTREAAVDQIKTGTRNYAKRQLTWFKRENNIQWFDVGEFGDRDSLNMAVYGYIQSKLHIS